MQSCARLARMVDGRLEAAISHWAPRFTAAGVYPVDFDRITSALDSWDEWCQGWSQAAAQHAELGQQALEKGRTRSAGGHLAQAAVYYHFAKFLFVHDMDQLRTAHERAVGCLTAALPYLDPPGTRLEIPFEGAVIAAVLRQPAGPGPHPAVVLIPGLDSAKEEFGAVEQLFLDRRVAALSVDGPGQGETRLDHGLYFGPDWQAHWRAVVDQVEAETHGLPLIMVGNSMGGCLTMNYAPHDPRIRAVCSNGGPLRPPPLTGELPSKLRKFVVFCGEADAGAVWGALDSGREMARSSQPLLILHGGADPLVTEAEVLEIAARAGADDVRVVVYSDGDHCIYNHPADKHDRIAEWIRAAVRRA